MQNLAHPRPSNFAAARRDWRRIAAIALPSLAAMVLAIGPLVWLANTWRDPAYSSNGGLIAALVAALAAWSLTSPARTAWPRHRRTSMWFALGLLLASALVRAAAQVGAVNILGGLTLVLDVYALGVLARLGERARPLSSAWLAIVFAFALPIERVLQRSLGQGLQLLSSDGACLVLGGFYDNLVCEGVRLVVDGRDVLVDVPCSGARTLMLAGFAFALAAAVARPSLRLAVIGAALMLAAAVASNVLRIVVLAIGIAHPEAVGGLDVMAQPWHDAIGLAALLVALLPLAAWIRAVERARPEPAPTAALHFIPYRLRTDGWWLETRPERRTRHHPVPVWAGALALSAALVVVNLPRRPLDVARFDMTLTAPAWIMGERAVEQPLLPIEAAYFTQHGGIAAKAAYGAHNLLLVRTTSPLRHLHAPDECLRGLGFDVTYLGLAFEPVETARYLATAPDGTRFRIDVSFVSNRGHVTGSVGGAVWHWLRGEAADWTAIQRISPAEVPQAEHAGWSSAALAVLGIEPIQPVRAATQGDVR